MTAAPPPRATIADLLRTEGRAELVGGRIVPIPLSGVWPGTLAGRIVRSLWD